MGTLPVYAVFQDKDEGDRFFKTGEKVKAFFPGNKTAVSQLGGVGLKAEFFNTGNNFTSPGSEL